MLNCKKSILPKHIFPILLGESLEAQGDVGTARRVYSYIPDRGLPFNNLAEGKLRRLAQKKD